MSQAQGKVLVIGYGNPGRLDDGLGPSLAGRLEKLSLSGITVDADYQLNVEDAAAVAEHDTVIFVDAATVGEEPFFFERVFPTPGLGFSSHSVSPGALLALAQELFQKKTEAWILGIRGYSFNEFGERLSLRAQANLEKAAEFLENTLRQRVYRPTPVRPTLWVATDHGENS